MPLIIGRYHGKGFLCMNNNTDIKLITQLNVCELLTLKIDVMLVSRGYKRTEIVYDKAGQTQVTFVPPRRK